MADVLVTGKTKRVVRGEAPHTVRLEAIDRLTGGDAARVSEIEAIGRAKTRQGMWLRNRRRPQPTPPNAPNARAHATVSRLLLYQQRTQSQHRQS